MRNTRPIVLLSALLLGSIGGVLPAPPAAAQAFCALRDPVHQVYDLFPEATSYRSVVRSVDNTHRSATAQRLPFTLHFNELGRHTLYVALKEGMPLGLVHVRSEAGRWGLVEIAWGLDLDLNITGYRFQRCRDTARSQVESSTVTQAIVGQGFTGLRAMLDAEGKTLVPSAQTLTLGAAPAAQQLLATTLRSALKTLVVTETVWAADLAQLRLMHQGLSAFPHAASIELIHDPYGHDNLADVLHRGVGASAGIDRAAVTALLIRDAHGKVLGLKLETPWSAGAQHARIWWTVSATERRLSAIESGISEGGPFHDLRGRDQDQFTHCSTAAELAGKEVITVANACLDAVLLLQGNAHR